MVAVDLDKCAKAGAAAHWDADLHQLDEDFWDDVAAETGSGAPDVERRMWLDAVKAILLAAGASISEAKPTLGDTQAVLPLPAKCAKGTHFVSGIGEAGWWCKDCGALARGRGPVEMPSCWQK